MYVYTYIYIYIYIYTHIHTYMYIIHVVVDISCVLNQLTYCICLYVHTLMCVYIYIYIYIQRERDIDIAIAKAIAIAAIAISISIYIYIYIYIHSLFFTADGLLGDRRRGAAGAPAQPGRERTKQPRQRASLRCYMLCSNMRRQRVFQAFSDPGAEKLQKLLSVGPQGYISAKTARNQTTTPKGKNFGRNFGNCSLQGLGQHFGQPVEALGTRGAPLRRSQALLAGLSSMFRCVIDLFYVVTCYI